jgi:hypothetical protein
MLESSWPTSEIAQEHLKNLISQGYMTMTELATSHVLKDPPSFVLVGGGRGGYSVVCATFYKQGFSVPSH